MKGRQNKIFLKPSRISSYEAFDIFNVAILESLHGTSKNEGQDGRKTEAKLKKKKKKKLGNIMFAAHREPEC
jgi:hypothetical protein